MAKDVILIQFDTNTKEYAYFAERGLCKQGDAVVVKNPCDRLVCATVSQIHGITKHQKSRACKWIVCRVDMESYEHNMKREQLATEVRERLKERRDELDEISLYQQLAKGDPVMARLLTSLADLEGDGGIAAQVVSGNDWPGLEGMPAPVAEVVGDDGKAL